MILLGSPSLYPRFGFEPGSAFGSPTRSWGRNPTDFEIAEEDFMVAVVGEGNLSGEVRWHPAFGEPVEGPAAGA